MTSKKMSDIHCRSHVMHAAQKELESPFCLDELKTILSKMDPVKPVASHLFLEKYLIFIIEDFLEWQANLKGVFSTTLIICGAKPRKPSESGNVLSSPEEDTSPLSVKFGSLLYTSEKSSASLLKKLNDMFSLYPLPEYIGRKLCCMCSSTKTEIVKTLPIATICYYGTSCKKAIVIGQLQKNRVNKRLSMENKGLISKENLPPRLSTLKDLHLQGFPPSFSSVQTTVNAHYDFLEYQTTHKTALKPAKNASLTVDCQWSDSSSILEPLTDDSTCFANIKTIEGSLDSGAFFLYKELKILEVLHQGLTSGQMKWPKAEHEENILKNIKDFIEGEKFAKDKSKLLQPIASSFNLERFDKVVEGNYRRLDFLEKLWGILKDCSYTEELKEALNYVYNSLGDFFKSPFVYHKSKSTLSVTIKNMREKLIHCPVLTSCDAIKLLLEIGVEKLRRDYASIFLSLELISHDSIAQFMAPELTSIDSITALRQLHSVLELSILCVKQLHFPKGLLSDFVRKAFKYYSEKPEINLQHVFIFPIPPVKARQLLNPMRPTTWQITFQSSYQGLGKKSIHRFQTTALMKHIYAPENYHPTLMLKDAFYVYTYTCLVEDDLQLEQLEF